MTRGATQPQPSSAAGEATLRARMTALWPDVVRPLRGLYGDRPDFDVLLGRLREQVTAAFAARSPELRALDEARLVTPDWFQRTDLLGYVCYTDRFSGTLRGLPDRIGYLRELGVTFLHLMPLLEPRPGPNDGGYAVADYHAVDPRARHPRRPAPRRRRAAG